MAVSSFFAGLDRATGAKERSRQREEKADLQQKFKEVGTSFLESEFGKTDSGKILGESIQKSLADPLQALTLATREKENNLRRAERAQARSDRLAAKKAAEEAERKRKEAIARLGKKAEELGIGKTDLGELTSMAMQEGLVEDPVSAINKIDMSPEEQTHKLVMKAMSDPSVAPFADASMKALRAKNAIEAESKIRIKKATQMMKPEDFYTKSEIDLGAVIPNIFQDIEEKFDIDSPIGGMSSDLRIASGGKAIARQMKGDPEKLTQLYDYTREKLEDELMKAQPLFREPEAKGNLTMAVEQLMPLILSANSPEFFGKTTGGKSGKRFEFNLFDIKLPKDLYYEKLKDPDAYIQKRYSPSEYFEDRNLIK